MKFGTTLKNLDFFFGVTNQCFFFFFFNFFPQKNLLKLPNSIHSSSREPKKKGCSKNFFSFFSSQIWLNWLMNNHHLGYITKLKKNTNVNLARSMEIVWSSSLDKVWCVKYEIEIVCTS